MTLCIQASLRGDYQIPNDKIDSGVFCLSLQTLVERVDKKVTLTLPLIVIQNPLLLLPSKQKKLTTIYLSATVRRVFLPSWS